MAFSVFFKEGTEIFSPSTYIPVQPKEHREVLQTLTDALIKKGSITHPHATKTNDGEWWIMLKSNNGDLYTYSIFISRFEQIEATEISQKKDLKKKELVIIDPNGARDSIGGYHPGYWTIAHYTSLLQEDHRETFLNIIHHIEHSIPSPFYTINNDGTIIINALKQKKTITISIECKAEWKHI